MSRKREQRLRPNAYHFCAMLLPFVLSSAYWAVQFAAELVRVQVFMLESTRRHASDHDVISFAPLFNAIILINVRRVVMPFAACGCTLH